MDGVGIPIIERPRPLPGHDTPNPTQHPYTLKCEEPTNRGISTIRFQHAKYNHGNYVRNYWGTIPIGSRRTKPPISTPDAGVTGAGWTGGHGQASRRGAERSEIAKSRGRAGLATVETTRRPQQREGRCTRYGARHPIRRGALPTDRVQRTQSQEQTRNLRDDRRHAQGPESSRSRGLSSAAAQPTLHVAPSRPSVTATSEAARRSRSSSARRRLDEAVAWEHEVSGGTYGAPRIRHALARSGVDVGVRARRIDAPPRACQA